VKAATVGFFPGGEGVAAATRNSSVFLDTSVRQGGYLTCFCSDIAPVCCLLVHRLAIDEKTRIWKSENVDWHVRNR
jgi:hypothetical protein